MNLQNNLGDRTKYIGGSDLPAIMGDGIKTRTQLLKEKKGLVKDEFTGNAFTKFGQDNEEALLEWLEKEDGIKVVGRQDVIDGECNDFPLKFHIDGRVDGEEILVEAKTAGTKKLLDDWAFDVPDYYKAQIIGYMKLKGYKKCIVVVGERTEDFTLGKITKYEIDFDEDYAKKLWVNLHNFIDSMRRDVIEMPEQMINDYLTLKEQGKLISDQLKVIEKTIKDSVEEFGVAGNHTITLSTVESNRFDSTAFKKDNPVEYNKYLKTSTSKKLTVK